MLIVGITGGIGCGKTAVTDHLAGKGITIVDADVVAREVVEPGEPALSSIAEHFGSQILTANGALDRAALRQKVFSSPAERSWLEALLHPIIRERIIQQLDGANGDYAVLSSPLLFETDQGQLTDLNIVIDLPESLQISRTMQRDDNSEAQVKAIIAAQMSRQQKRQQADKIISNDADLASLYKQVDQLHLALVEKSRTHDE